MNKKVDELVSGRKQRHAGKQSTSGSAGESTLFRRVSVVRACSPRTVSGCRWTSLSVRLGRDAHVWFSGSNELGPTGRSPSLGGRVDGQMEEQLGEGEASDWVEGRG